CSGWLFQLSLEVLPPLMFPMTVTPLGWDQDCSLKIREPEVPAPWFLDPGGWSKTAAVSLYFIFPGICTLSLVGHGSPTPCDAEPPCACAGSTYSAAAAGLLCGGVWPAPIDKHKPWLEPTYHRIVTENNNTVLLNLSPIALDKDSPLRFAVQALDSGYYNYTATNNVDNLAKKTVNLLVQSLKNATFQITPKVIKENRNIQLCQDLKLLCHLDAVTRRSYEIHLIPYTTFGANFFGANFGMTSQVIHYTEAFNSPNLSDSTCHFEDEKICDYTQGLTDNFDWTQQNALTQNPKCSPNTGPPTDINGTPEGYYMFIETSKPQELGNHARLVSPLYNASTKFYCVSFFYHVYGKHISSFNLLVKSRNKV
ncbi:hypothetical protein STEG23_010528, partial [Scotinomys teguina]